MADYSVEEVLRIEDLAVSQNEETAQLQRDDVLKNELAGVKALNKVIEDAINAMTRAKDNMGVCSVRMSVTLAGCHGRRKCRQTIRHLDQGPESKRTHPTIIA
jgi:hypothetical protein